MASAGPENAGLENGGPGQLLDGTPMDSDKEAVAQEETPAMTQNNAADMCEVCLLALHRVPALHWYGVAIRGFAHHAPTL